VSDPLKDMFTQMDAADEDTALAAMRDAGTLLRSKGLGFGRVVERLEHSLMPAKIVATLKMFDGPTHEAANAFRAAKKMLKGNGLTFMAIARALEQSSYPAEIDRLSEALADARADREHYAAEVRRLRSEVSQMRTRAALRTRSTNPWKQWITIGALSLICLWVWSPTSGARGGAAVRTAAVVGVAWPERGTANRSPPARCWRDRSISRQCSEESNNHPVDDRGRSIEGHST
jgi:hypothetical protein